MGRSILFTFILFFQPINSFASKPYVLTEGTTLVLKEKADSLQSYKEWKTQKIQQLQTHANWLKASLEYRKNQISQKKSLTKTEAQLSQEMGLIQLQSQFKDDMLSLEMANELTVSDYFAAYLTKQKNKKEAFKQVAGKMSPEEVADLMSAYANSAFLSQGISAPAQGSDVTDDKVK